MVARQSVLKSEYQNKELKEHEVICVRNCGSFVKIPLNRFYSNVALKIT